MVMLITICFGSGCWKEQTPQIFLRSLQKNRSESAFSAIINIQPIFSLIIDKVHYNDSSIVILFAEFVAIPDKKNGNYKPNTGPQT